MVASFRRAPVAHAVSRFGDALSILCRKERSVNVALPVPLLIAILFCAVGVVVMGVYPEPWVKAALQATAGLF